MRRSAALAVSTVATLIAAGLATIAPAAAEEPPPIISFAVGPPFTTNAVVTGPDGALWQAITAQEGRPGADLARFDPATGDDTPTDLAAVVGALALTFTPAGDLWVLGDLAGGTTDRLVQVDPADRAALDQLDVPRSNGARGLATTADGHLWYVTDTAGDPLVEVDPATDTVTRHALPALGGADRGFGTIALGPDGNLWVPVLFSSSDPLPVGSAIDDPDVLVRITPAGTLTQIDTGAQLSGVLAMTGGAVWFGISTGIGRVDPDTTDVQTWPVAPAASVDALAAGPDGRTWFSDGTTRALGALDPDTGTVTVTPTPGARPTLLTTDGSGALWFVDGEQFLARVDPATGAFTARARGVHRPTLLLDGPDGRLWTASGDGFVVGALDPHDPTPADPAVEALHVGHPVTGLAEGPGDTVVFSAADGHVGRIDPATLALSTSATPGVSQPSSILADADGDLWVTGFANDTLGEIDPTTGVVTTHPSGGVDGPGALVADGAGGLWFTGELNDTLGELDPATGAVVSHSTGTITDPLDAAVTPDGAVWAIGRSDIFRFDPTTDTGTVYPTGLTNQRAVTVGPDGNLWVTAPRRVARIDAQTGEVTTFTDLFHTATSTAQGEWGITTGGDGNLWVTTRDGGLPWLHRFAFPHPELTVALEAEPTSAAPGDEITYTAKLSNAGNVALDGVAVTDAGVPGCIGPVGDGTLAPGAEATVECTRTTTGADVGEDRSDTVTADADQTDPVSSAPVVVTVAFPPHGYADVQPSDFWDAPAAWARFNAITPASANFRGADPLRRAQAVSWFYAMFDRPTGSPRHRWSDVPRQADYKPALHWATAQQLVTGYPHNRFKPDKAINRAQFTWLLWNLLDRPDAGAHTHPFTDVPDGAWYEEALDWADSVGMAAVPGGGTAFSPKAPVSRAEALTAAHHVADAPDLWAAYDGTPPATVLF